MTEAASSSGASAEPSVSSSTCSAAAAAPPVAPLSVACPPAKKKRSLPGMPDPDAEVIALSPRTLLATNRFVCEICGKGFQRDQNLQLHRRGHNLPWKLRQRPAGKDGQAAPPRKRVYVCPEPGCVHHDPARALGDLTGVKKHFCRKHGEKKWKCDRCAKRYAVRSDWKAHAKTCGSREYRCDCGTLFSRRDSFITHRAFCDALAEETAKAQAASVPAEDGVVVVAETEPAPALAAAAVLAAPLQQLTPSQEAPATSPEQEQQSENNTAELHPYGGAPNSPVSSIATSTTAAAVAAGDPGIFAGFFSSDSSPVALLPSMNFPELGAAIVGADRGGLPSEAAPSLRLGTGSPATFLFPRSPLMATSDCPVLSPPPPSPLLLPHLSATALLQKATQIGVAASSSSYLRGLGIELLPGSAQGMAEWHGSLDTEAAPLLSPGLALGPQYHGGGSLTLPELMMGSQSLFGVKPMTVDFLGLGVAGSNAGGLSTFLPSIDDGLGAARSAAMHAEASFDPNGGSGRFRGKAWER